jgi:surfeit locus 1 family protein
MPSVLFFKFRFTPSWVMFGLTTLFISLFVCLGFWQIHRADEKAAMLAARSVQANLPAVVWGKNKKLPMQYEQMKLEGTYLTQLFLLDNQHHQHQFGYNVLSPLLLEDGSVVMIDRGWVLGDVTRRVVPTISIPSGSIKLHGSAYYPSKNQWVLGPAIEKKGDKTIILERLDEKLVSQILQKTVYPFIIRLDKKETQGFVREWETVSIQPSRHLGYALQWFSMAFVILILFVALNLKKEDEEKNE